MHMKSWEVQKGFLTEMMLELSLEGRVRITLVKEDGEVWPELPWAKTQTTKQRVTCRECPGSQCSTVVSIVSGEM